MKHTKKIYILILSLVFIFVDKANAQVVVGPVEDVQPSSFSILQLEGETGGLRLPRVTTLQMTTMGSSLTGNDNADGLVVYNTEDDLIYFWDGDNWIPLSGGGGPTTVSGNNGITTINSPTNGVRLGGTINTPTTINMNNFNFDITQNSGDLFYANGVGLHINDSVNMKPGSGLHINDPAFGTIARNVTIVPEKMSVNNNTLSLNASPTLPGIGFKGALTYKPSAADPAADPDGNLLVSDVSGVASWQPVRPMGSVAEGELYNDSVFKSTDIDITKKPLVLPPGKWLIFAKVTCKATGTSDERMYHWMGLESKAKKSSTKVKVTKTGTNPELNSSGTIYSCPNMVCMVDIKVQTEYFITMGTSNSDLTNKTSTEYGGSYFYALNIDAPTP